MSGDRGRFFDTAGSAVDPSAAAQHVLRSYEIRDALAQTDGWIPIPTQITNNDEQRYTNFIGNFLATRAISSPEKNSKDLRSPSSTGRSLSKTCGRLSRPQGNTAAFLSKKRRSARVICPSCSLASASDSWRSLMP
jgi:hypothetical protein